MTDLPNIPTGRAILRAVRASMKLVDSSLELLTESQLIAMRSDLHRTLAIVNGRLSPAHPSKFAINVLKSLVADSYSTANQKVVIDLSDWDSDGSDKDENSDRNVPGSECSIFFDVVTAVLQK